MMISRKSLLYQQFWSPQQFSPGSRACWHADCAHPDTPSSEETSDAEQVARRRLPWAWSDRGGNASAADKVVLQFGWFAEPDSGGFLQAQRTGVYARHGRRCVDMLIAEGVVTAIGPHIEAAALVADLGGGLVLPAFVELHTHLDKGHIAPRARNRDGTVLSAVEAVRADRVANWTAEDVERRLAFSLGCAFAHGTAAIRTHIDCYPPQRPISWPVFARMRDEWAGRVALQGVSLALLDDWSGDERRALADLTARYGGLIGGVTRVSGALAEQTTERIAAGLERLFVLAEERGLDVDLHVDETAEPEPDTLKLVAQTVLRRRFNGRVVCGHCCSLALRADDEAAQTIALVREAGISVVTLPLVNLHLQGRGPGRTRRWRGVTPVQELVAAGVTVAAASDKTRDPFYAFGDLDALEVFRETVRICHLDLDPWPWPRAVTRAPADLMGLLSLGRIAVGLSADLVIFAARTAGELLARPESDRLVLRARRPSLAALPDYRELDPLFGR
jgi:cytosine/creatinine deaminase